MPDDKYDGLTSPELLIAMFDEVTIEACLCRAKAGVTPLIDEAFIHPLLAEDMREALRAIDSLKIAGTYEQERQRLAEIRETNSPVELQRFFDAMDEWHRSDAGKETQIHRENFAKGLRSHRPQQRTRFDAVRQVLLDHRIMNAGSILAALERAPSCPANRPMKFPPWRDDSAALDGMRLAVAAGKSLNSASLEALADLKAGRENKARELCRKFRKRVELRGKKSK